VKLAIFGGTFDPIHEAHLAVAREAAGRFQLDRVLLIPAAHPPHKAGVTQAPYVDRLRMTELACQCDPRFEASDLEANTLQSYSIDTIEKVRAGLAAEDELFFIIGADAFSEIRSWHRWREVARQVCFLVVSRPGHIYDTPSEVSLVRLDTVEMAVSSSGIRATLARGGRPAAVPACVLEYIFANGLYGAKKGTISHHGEPV
jgi:nicotinate-nucleotide adenylyltransferase